MRIPKDTRKTMTGTTHIARMSIRNGLLDTVSCPCRAFRKHAIVMALLLA